ncbi:MAG TPA: Xaa-Pro peptidase family protein [Tepidisphaeraceae bacterium]|jgi:Xaa-Pro aminopeptidase|nr:Xaa-Pro peptidase family protein [Tepidisphaeraceae bacterium]
MLDAHKSRNRQQRLLDRMGEAKLDAVVVGLPQHVYYLSTWWTDWKHQSAFILFSDGRSWLATANQPAQDTAADEVVGYEAQWMSTLRQEQPQVVGQMVTDLLKSRRAKHIGIDASQVTSQVARMTDAKVEPIDPILWQMRRTKDIDELALIQEAVTATAAMFDHARKIVEPGVAELDVYTQLHEVAVKTTGEPMTAPLGNDFACGSGGGPPRKDRRAKAGELYILDLGPTYRGYFADTCRAFSVDRKPTDAQHQAWQTVVEALNIVEKLARPGVKCTTIFSAVDEHFKAVRGKGISHHLGHGIGLQPHEFPHLNPKWDDILLEGEVFTAEPGVYGPELQGGIRLENNYLVTSDGVKNLLNSPLAL